MSDHPGYINISTENNKREILPIFMLELHL